MKVVTLQQLEQNFDAILEDVEINKEHYRIQCEKGDVMLIPIESYNVLKETYKEWVEEPQNTSVEGFDPGLLPVEYIAEAEPRDLTAQVV
jgi:PHD/YefM family antitoxin component YafN of YafNO toxin-antitoxin module